MKRSRLVQALISACPVLGLLGAVFGFIDAAAGLQMGMDMQYIADGVSVVFDTLLFGLATGILLWIVSSVLQEREVRAAGASSAELLQGLLAKVRTSG